MISKKSSVAAKSSVAIVCSDIKQLSNSILSEQEINFIQTENKKNEKQFFAFNRFDKWIFVQLQDKKTDSYVLEKWRKAGSKCYNAIAENKLNEITLLPVAVKPEETLAFAEGIALSNYAFSKYKTDKKGEPKLQNIIIADKNIKEEAIQKLNILVEAIFHCRDLVNEPVSYLNAEKLASEFVDLGKESGVKVEVLNHIQIESLKMGGLLAVNKGSIDPPTFTIMTWKPANAVNKNPVVLVGKGLVYDTGGLNLKPGDYMNDMKSDMAGGATMACTLYAIAKAKLPVYAIALIPATDNRPGGNAYASGDIITMYDGTTVEVGNTDAEGRIILGDALSYAKKYKPELVIDAATLTGAASRAIGQYGIVAMHNKAEKPMQNLKNSGEKVYERIAEFPFWDEYGDMIKSKIADIQNVGGSCAGMITAGKFLSHFTDYPYIHLDIAGVAFYDKKENYHPQGGTGYGIRLLFEFLEQKIK